MAKVRVQEVIIVEGRYDALVLADLVDGLILTTGGFSIFTDQEQKSLIQKLGRRRGLLILTDSDAAGFRIRHYVEKIAGNCRILHAYIPALYGKEPRKATSSKEGTLGVEGLPPAVLRKALEQAGISFEDTQDGPASKVPGPAAPSITYTDLFTLGLSGSSGSTVRRRALLTAVGLPPRLSKRALRQVLNSLYTREEFFALANAAASSCE